MRRMINGTFLVAAGLVLAGCDTTPTAPAYLAADVVTADSKSPRTTTTNPALGDTGSTAAERAGAVVAAAFELLGRAESLAGDNPSTAIADALARAASHCSAARSALDAGDYRLAVEEAGACAQISRWVIGSLAGGGGDDTASKERAEAVVAHAGELYSTAAQAAGGGARPEILAMLTQARELLDAAVSALEEGDYREAIRAGQQSARLSQQVLRALGNTRPNPGNLQEEATQAVATAQALLAQVAQQMGPNSPPQAAQVLSQAAQLIGEANAALAKEEWRTALRKAQQAIALLGRLSSPR